jgi:hypothetical protein
MGIKTRQLATEQSEENKFNISLLGFKMAVNEGLTVFNLVDGIVDEFNDESGTDEAEGSNDLYCGTSDYYINSNVVSGLSSVAVSAGFSGTAITEPDTSTAGTNGSVGNGTPAQWTLSGPVNLTISAWGPGGAGGYNSPTPGGGGGFVTGTYAFSGPDILYIVAGEGGPPYPMAQGDNAFGGDNPQDSSEAAGTRGGGGAGNHAGGGGLAFVGTNVVDQEYGPDIIMIAGGGGAGGQGPSPGGVGGAGGGTAGQAGTGGGAGGGGQQSQGGAAGASNGNVGGFLYGGAAGGGAGGGGGAGYYGGGGSGSQAAHGTGGGGSSYFGHPQVTSGSTEGGNAIEGGGVAASGYVAGTNEGGVVPGTGNATAGEDGYVLFTAAGVCASTTSTVIMSEPFAASSPVTTGRMVVFEENVATPTLNTDIIASISRDGGTTFTAATLADSGYVTGSSGQRILTGQATISGQPSGQSMRWKLALANNTVKIHGVSLQWS